MVEQVTIKHQPTEAEQVKKLLEENLEYSRANYAMLEKVNRHLRWEKIFTVIKILLILVPLILGFIYLPPLIQQALSGYQELLK